MNNCGGFIVSAVVFLAVGLSSPFVLVRSDSASASVRTSRRLMFGLRLRPDLRRKAGSCCSLACILDSPPEMPGNLPKLAICPR